jgi:EF hand
VATSRERFSSIDKGDAMLLNCTKLFAALASGLLIAGLSTDASASDKKHAPIVLLPAPVHGDVVPTHRSHKLKRVARHGVYYYVPRAIVTVPHAYDDEWDESYDESDDDEFDGVDRDHDGFISLREARRSQPDWARDFRKIDASGDGYLTREEVDAFYRR